MNTQVDTIIWWFGCVCWCLAGLTFALWAAWWLWGECKKDHIRHQEWCERSRRYVSAIVNGYTVYLNGEQINPDHYDMEKFFKYASVNDDKKVILITK